MGPYQWTVPDTPTSTENGSKEEKECAIFQVVCPSRVCHWFDNLLCIALHLQQCNRDEINDERKFMTVDSHVTYMYSFSLKFNRKCRTHSTSRSLSLSLSAFIGCHLPRADWLPASTLENRKVTPITTVSFLPPSLTVLLAQMDTLYSQAHSHIHVHHTVVKGCWESNLAQSRNCFPLRDAYGYMGLSGISKRMMCEKTSNICCVCWQC